MSVKKALGAVLTVVSMVGAAQAQTFYASGDGNNGNGGPAVMGCTTTANGTPAVWVRVDGNFQGYPAVVVVPEKLIRGRGIDFSMYNNVVRNRSDFVRAAEQGQVPYLTGLDNVNPLQQQGFVQPSQNADEFYTIFYPQNVRDRKFFNRAFCRYISC